MPQFYKLKEQKKRGGKKENHFPDYILPILHEFKATAKQFLKNDLFRKEILERFPLYMQVNNTLTYRKFTQIVIEVKIQTHLLAKQK